MKRAGAGERAVVGAYGSALALVLASVITSITLDERSGGLLVAGLLQGMALIVVLRVSGATPRAIAVAIAFSVVATLLAAGVTYTQAGEGVWAVPLLWALIVVGAIAAIGRHLRTYTQVNLRVILGLLTVYLLLGLLFAYAFMLVGAVSPPFFSAGEQASGAYVYFSYVTMATIGYGDLVPVDGLPRALAVIEGVLGQLYLVTVVALAVGRFGGKRPA